MSKTSYDDPLKPPRWFREGVEGQGKRFDDARRSAATILGRQGSATADEKKVQGIWDFWYLVEALHLLYNRNIGPSPSGISKSDLIKGLMDKGVGIPSVEELN